MKFWFRFYQEEGWWLACCPDLDRITQGHDYEEAAKMAGDLLVCMLGDTWGEGQDIAVSESHPDEPGEWRLVGVPIRPYVAMLIRRERKRRHLTMQQVADKLGIKLGTYQRFEDVLKSNLTLGSLERIFKVLGQEISFRLAS